MAYTYREAIKTAYKYLNIDESKVKVIDNTNGRGIVYDFKGVKTVIFIYPISCKQNNKQNFFDTRDSGAKERGVAWKYARDNELRYFCLGFNEEQDRYKDYILSLESDESYISNISFRKASDSEATGTQVNIPNDFIPEGKFVRIQTPKGFFISAIKKEHAEEYLQFFDNRPYMLDADADFNDEDPEERNKSLFRDWDCEEIFSHSLFGIHIKEKNTALSDDNPHICIGWSDMGDLSEITDRAELAALYDEHFEKNNRGRGQDIGQVWRFINDVQKGDYVIFAENSVFHIGRVESEYYFDKTDYEGQSSDYRNTRKVRWLKKDISRTVLSSDLHNSLKTAMSIWTLNDYKSAVSDLLRGTYQKGDEDREEAEESMGLTFETGLNSKYKRNRILFGAPGTGKSFTLNQEREELLGADNEMDYERVTFHPDYSYANFVGTYKPTMVKHERASVLDEEKKKVIAILQDKSKTAQEKYDLLYETFKGENLTRLPVLLGIYTDESFKTKKMDGTDAVGDNSVERNHGRAIRPYLNLSTSNNEEKEISYEYVPGPFMRVLVKALKSAMSGNPKPYLLIVEEINRANVASVFGDVFQLLDRDKKNISEYSISTTNDMRTYLAEQLEVDENAVKTIKIPDNLFIWATMNSADQGVFPMDTAFKRRWNFTYLGIDDAVETYSEKILKKKYILGKGEYARLVNWNDLREAINDVLSSEAFNINEDKLLGPYFIAKAILESDDDTDFKDVFKNKVLMYLFDDAVKQKRKTFFEECKDDVKGVRYSDICKLFDIKGVFIFPTEISKRFSDKPKEEKVEANN